MKKALIIICILVALILLFPIREQAKDGGYFSNKHYTPYFRSGSL